MMERRERAAAERERECEGKTGLIERFEWKAMGGEKYY